MQLASMLLAVLPLFSSLVSATALTYKIAANEKACFFTDVERQNAKVAFYFAVSFNECSYKTRRPLRAMTFGDELTYLLSTAQQLGQQD